MATLNLSMRTNVVIEHSTYILIIVDIGLKPSHATETESLALKREFRKIYVSRNAEPYFMLAKQTLILRLVYKVVLLLSDTISKYNKNVGNTENSLAQGCAGT